jgi:hypothetical protein
MNSHNRKIVWRVIQSALSFEDKEMRLIHLRTTSTSLIILAVVICLSCSSFVEPKESSVAAQMGNANQNQNGNLKSLNQTAKTSNTPLPAPTRPKVLSRREWKAKDAISKMQQHTLRYITIHHTASPQKQGVTLEKKMQNLQNFSQSESRLASGKNKPAWPDVPYHYYIAVDGQIAEGREINLVGDTNTDYDPTGHALIVLEGNFENEQPTSRQLESLREFVAWMSAHYAIPVSEIKAHNDYASTACPGVNLKNALPALRQKVIEIRGLVDKK